MEERVIGEGPEKKYEAPEGSSGTVWAPFFLVHWPSSVQPSLSLPLSVFPRLRFRLFLGGEA